MSKIDIKKTELVWRGKYDDEGKLMPVEKAGPFPFQIVESINEPRIERGGDDTRQSSLFDIWKGDEGNTFEDGWKNKLIWGDNKFVMSSLLERFSGKIDLIYIDPPFATGADFTVDIEVGEKGEEIHKEHSIIEEKAYRDTWGQGLESFLQMMYDRLILMRELLSEKGSLYVHCDYRVNSHLRLVLNEIFGDNYFSEIIWQRSTTVGSSKAIANRYPTLSDHILVYSKNKSNCTFNKQYTPPSDDYKSRFKERDKYGFYYWNTLATYSQDTYDRLEKEGKVRWTAGAKFPQYKTYLHELKGNVLSNVWTDINMLNPMADERLNYPTQKPEELLKRIIAASSNEGDLIADFFCGSGTTISVAEKLGRRWIGVDLGRFAIHTTRKRLLEMGKSKNLTDESKLYGKNVKPFEILNLGKYERQFWQVKAFGRKDEKEAFYEYLSFMLKLYSAEPISGSTHVHGKKGPALVYIGAVDAPVTIQEVTDALNDTREIGMKELHVLGWEWEMGLNEAIQEVVHQMGIRLKLRIIPMDAIDPQASGRGDVKFFELAYFKSTLETKGMKLKVKLEDYVMPHTDLVPQVVKESIKKWSDWIDYWALDFDFQNDTFNNTWTSYRTKQDRKLKYMTEHEYSKAGTYKVYVKIIDIFGIDTSQVYEIKVK